MKQEVFRHVPYDIECEQALLGQLLLSAESISVAAAELEPHHFYDPFHSRLYEMIVHLSTEGKVTPLVIHAVMKNDPGMQELGGHAYLVGLAQAAPALPNIPDLARILRELAARRVLIKIGEDIVNAAYDGPQETESNAIVSKYTDRLLRVAENRRGELSTMGTAALKSVQRVQDRMNGKSSRFITTGSDKIDRVIGGMQPGDRIGVAGRSGIGKSALASSISLAAARSGAPVLVLSGDMREQQWSDRVICDIDRYLHPASPPIHYSQFRRANSLSDDEWRRIVIAQQELATLTNYAIDANPVLSLPAIISRATAFARAHPDQPGLLVLDFLQKASPPDKQGYTDKRRDEELTDFTYKLGDAMKDLGWVLLALIQLLNKSTDAKGNLSETPPNATAIRECGGIEMALDIIVGVYRKAYFIERRPDDIATKTEALNADTAFGWKVRNHIQTLGWKNRDDSPLPLNLDLWCDMGSASVRDCAPPILTPAEQAANALGSDLWHMNERG